MRFGDLRLAKKITGIFLLMSLFLVLVSVFTHVVHQEMTRHMQITYEQQVAATQILHSCYGIAKDIALTDQTILLVPLNQADRDLLAGRVRERLNLIDELLLEYEQIQADALTRKWLDEYRWEQRYYYAAVRVAIQLRDGDPSASPYRFYVDNAMIHRDNMEVLLRVMVDRNTQLTQARGRMGQTQKDRLALVIVGSSLLSFLLALYLGRMLNRLVAGPITNLLEEMEKVSEGNYGRLSIYLPVETKDEIGKLSRAFFRMARALQRHLSDVEEKNRQIFRIAHEDFLTELPNRRQFLTRIDELIDECLGQRRNFAIIYIDLDRFKDINDTYGHSTGDKLLLMVAKRLKIALGEVDMLARLGGDEFTVIVVDDATTERMTKLAESIMEAFAQPYQLEGHTFYCSASMGIALYPDHGTDAEMLLRAADTAMFDVKRAASVRYRLYTDEMHKRLVKKTTIERCLHQAIDGEGLYLHYQPKVDLKSGEVTGIEALLRWNSRELGNLAPGEFIHVAEEAQLIIPLGRWVLERVCRDIGNWRARNLSVPRVAVNLSPRQFRQSDMAAEIKSVTRHFSVDPNLLEVEITEGTLMDKTSTTLEQIRRIRDLGITVAVDDFGTGYSSLEYLNHFPIDCLKIDRSFICKIGLATDMEGITRVIIGMAHDMGLKVIAEGVETENQAEYLRRHRCDEAQGFLFYRPMPTDEVAALLANRPQKD